MTAADYPITFGYGATDGVYYGPNGSIGPYHRGDDRAMPNGTLVVVNGVQIGLSNNTGASSGSHLHIGRFINGSDTNPNGEGFNLKSPVKVTTVSQDNTNGKYVRLTDGDGVQWVYLHLQEQSVSVGQVLQGGNMPDNSQLADLRLGWLNEIGALVSVKGPIDGNNVAQVIANISNQAKQIDTLTALAEDRLKQIQSGSSGDFVPVTEQLYKKK